MDKPPPVIDFPKIHSPFVRQTINGRYVVTPEIAPGYEWVFKDAGVRAVDKLHGTNICVHVSCGRVMAIDNRKNRLIDSPELRLDLTGMSNRAMEGVIFAAQRLWLPLDSTSRIYGELIGPSINGNMHQLDHHLFVPFEYLKSCCHWTTYVSNKYPKTYEAISDWFKTLESRFVSRLTQQHLPAEGLIFYHPDGRMAKLRRDMFDWYEGPAHEE